MSASFLLVHGDDGFGPDSALRAVATEIDATDTVEVNAAAA